MPNRKSTPSLLGRMSDWEDETEPDASCVSPSQSEEDDLEGTSGVEPTTSTTTEQTESKDSKISKLFQSLLLSLTIPFASPKDDETFTFPLDPTHDSKLLKTWHGSVLPAILSNQKAFGDLRSIHVSRQGSSLEDSIPTIIVTCAEVTNKVKVDNLHRAVSDLFDRTDRQSLRIAFDEGKLRRTTKLHDPPICTPRNIEGQLFPSFGSSIGIQRRTDSTATLGGYLLIDGEIFLLTVDHLINEQWTRFKPVPIAHPSEQEQLEHQPRYNLLHYIDLLKACCAFCKKLAEVAIHKEFDVMELYNPPEYKCATSQLFQRANEESIRRKPRLLGILRARSDMRSRRVIAGELKHEIEMDWALFYVDKWPKPIDSHAQEISRGLSFGGVVPGALIQATGRTSGYQRGVINTAQSLINHGTRMTLEWSVIPEPGSSINSWILGGIGVDGDSGSWIINQENGSLYGMVWGRHGPLANPICLFTPMEHIIADIKERAEAENVCLPGQGEGLDVGREVSMQEEVLDFENEKGKGKGKGKVVTLQTASMSSQLPKVEKTVISGEVEISPATQQMSAG
ncbi:hypothetical protein DL95DRAFT_483673 [Leptodontidium sp. 2 PMI_412]|nr:hypothetical protein DL95DRAFT_483673 [Leptodontidium sp. 2 PMI_412]